MTDYTPTTKEVRAAWIDAHRVDTPLGGRMDMEARPRERIREFDRWMASVLAEQGEPEWEYRISDGDFIHYTQSRSRVARALQRGLYVWRRVPGVPAIPAGQWLPVEEPESTDGSERLGVAMPDEEFVLARPWRSSAHVRIEWPVIRNACGYCGWEHPPRDHNKDADRTIRSGDPLDCPACGYDPMAPHNGKGDCAIDRTSGCRDCGCPDRSDDHLREEWSCGCQCHTDRTNGSTER